jgi:hypothetical protein
MYLPFGKKYVLIYSHMEEMKLLTKLSDLSDETLRMTANFPGQYAHVFRDRIIESMGNIESWTQMANAIRATSEAKEQERIDYQEKILAEMRTLERLMQQAVRLEATSPKRVKRWVGLLTESKKMYYGWKKGLTKH